MPDISEHHTLDDIDFNDPRIRASISAAFAVLAELEAELKAEEELEAECVDEEPPMHQTALLREARIKEFSALGDAEQIIALDWLWLLNQSSSGRAIRAASEVLRRDELTPETKVYLYERIEECPRRRPSKGCPSCDTF